MAIYLKTALQFLLFNFAKHTFPPAGSPLEHGQISLHKAFIRLVIKVARALKAVSVDGRLIKHDSPSHHKKTSKYSKLRVGFLFSMVQDFIQSKLLMTGQSKIDVVERGVGLYKKISVVFNSASIRRERPQLFYLLAELIFVSNHDITVFIPKSTLNFLGSKLKPQRIWKRENVFGSMR